MTSTTLSPVPCPRQAAAAPAVSVCIASWNCRDLLRNCLLSLRQQDADLEVIVVDNASTDGAAEMTARDFPEVVLIRNAANRGFAVANNQAAAAARGRYLFFLNNDTELPPGTVANLLRFADQHPDAGIIGPRLRDARGNVQDSARGMPSIGTFLHKTLLLRWTGLFRRAYHRYRRGLCQAKEPCEVELMMGAAMLIRRNVFDRHGGWNESYRFGGEDMDLCRRVGERHRLLYHPGIELLHHGRASTKQNTSLTAVEIPVGFARFFRQSGCTPLQLLAYKVCITIDAALQCLAKGSQYLFRRLAGQPRRAARSLDEVRRHVRFLTRGLLPFWNV